MAIRRFEDVVAWQKSQEFAVEIYSAFRLTRDYGFKDQICRAVVSISNNIAEGFDRSSNPEFVRFLYIALGSCSEVRSMLYLAVKLNHMPQDTVSDLIKQANEISKIITGLIKSMNTKQQ